MIILGGPEKGRFCRLCLIDLSGLLGEEDSLDVGKDSSLGDGDTSKKFPHDNSWFFVIPGSVSGQLKDLSAQVLKNSCKVNWGSSSNTLTVVALK